MPPLSNTAQSECGIADGVRSSVCHVSKVLRIKLDVGQLWGCFPDEHIWGVPNHTWLKKYGGHTIGAVLQSEYAAKSECLETHCRRILLSSEWPLY